jgi:hypothetical protein
LQHRCPRWVLSHPCSRECYRLALFCSLVSDGSWTVLRCCMLESNVLIYETIFCLDVIGFWWIRERCHLLWFLGLGWKWQGITCYGFWCFNVGEMCNNDMLLSLGFGGKGDMCPLLRFL